MNGGATDGREMIDGVTLSKLRGLYLGSCNGSYKMADATSNLGYVCLVILCPPSTR